MPSDAAQLDQLVGGERFVDLVKRLSTAKTGNDVLLDMNWEQKQVFNGGGFIIAFAYMRDLWRYASAAPSPAADDLKQSAGMMLLYTFALIELDGPQCSDPTAPHHRLDQLAMQGRPILDYLKALQRTERMQVGSMALALELATSQVRGRDSVLCRDGMQESMASMKALGDKPAAETPCPPGSFGVCRALPTDPNFKPGYLNETEWKPRQAELRRQLPSALTQILSVPGEAVSEAKPR